jgi:hypothetical protein
MLLPWHQNRQTIAFAVLVGLLAAGEANAENRSVFDLEWDGPETSTVEECVDESYFCYRLPITGSLGVDFAGEAPTLININSDILIPPQLPGSPPFISPNVWFNFDLLAGEYLTTDGEDIAMVFRPAEIGGVLRAYELFVNITDHGRMLELTGGIEQDATSPLEPDVRFAVSGRLRAGDPDAVPEPNSLFLAAVAAMAWLSVATSKLPITVLGSRGRQPQPI